MSTTPQNNKAASVGAETTSAFSVCSVTPTVADSTPHVNPLVAAVGHEPRWLAWEISADAKEKTPRSPKAMYAASDNPATWVNYNTARAFCDANGYAIGIALTNLPEFTPLVIVDFDHVCGAG